MPRGLSELLGLLQEKPKKGASALASYLLDMNGDWRIKVFDGVSGEVADAANKQPRPMSTHGNVRVTLFPWSAISGVRDGDVAIDHTMALLLLNNEQDRVLLELSYGLNGMLEDANWSTLTQADIPSGDLVRLREMADRLRARRIGKASGGATKVGRNESCPCGSGKKFKKCCLLEL